MNNQIDTKINELFSIVRKKKIEIEAAEKESKQSWKTNCSVVAPFVRDEAPINLQTANQDKIKLLVMSLLNYRDYAKEAEELLGVDSTDQYSGFSYDDWFTDCKKRISVIGIRAKKEQLTVLESRLNAIVSPEQKRQMELDAIMAELN